MGAGPSNRPAGKSWLRGFAIISLILILPPALYFFVYVEQRVDTAGRHAYGVLAAVTSDLKSRIQAYEKIARNAEKAPNPKQFLRSLPGARIEARGAGAGEAAKPAVVPRLSLTPSAMGGLELHVDRLGTDVAIVPFKGLIPWYLVNSEFDGLLVFDGKDHQLIAQDRRLAEQSLGETVVLRRGDKQIALAEFVGPKGEVDTEPASLLQRREWLVRVAGVEYRPFVQRLRVPVSGAKSDSISGEIDVVLVGLIQSERFWRDAVALSPRTFVRAGALLLLALLVIPFLKLRFIGANERMRPFDIWLLAGSVPLASALLVLLVLNEYAVSILRQRFDDSLRAFGATIERHVEKEVASIQGELGREPTVRTLFSDAASLSQTQGVARGSILTQTPLDYPLLEALFLSGHHDGEQLAKMMPRTIPTGMVTVGSLPYYPNGLSLQDRPFTFSPDIAITSGLRLGIFSVPVSLRHFGPDAPMSRFVGSQLPVQDRDGILAVATPMPSLNDAIVSAPFEFVVLERGLVVFQSASGPFLGERFYERVENGETLKYAAQLAAPAGTEVRSYDYRGRTYRMLPIRLNVLANPEGSSPIDLVVYYEERNVGSLAAAAFATGVALSFVVIVSLLLGAFVANVFFRSEALSWAWPSVRRNRWYAGGILAGAAVALIMLGVVSYFPGIFVPWMLVAVPSLTLLIAGAASWWRSRSLLSMARCGSAPHVSPAEHRIHQGLFVGFGVIAILVLAALPAALAYDRALGFFTARFEGLNAEKLESEWLGRSPLKDQPIVKKSGAGTPLDRAAPKRPCADTNGESGQPIEDPRCVTTDRIYADETNYETFRNMELDLRRYDSCVDVRDEGSCRCPLTGAREATAECVIVPTGVSAAAVGADPRSWLAVFDSGSGALSDLMSGRSSTILWCGLLFAVIVTAALVRSVAKNVLGLHLTDRLAVEGPAMPTPGPNRSWLFLRPPMRVVRRLINAPGVRSLDLSDPALTAEQLAQDRSRDEEMLVIRNVELRLKDEAWRDALRHLIQNRGTRGIALTSEIDPYYFLAQQRREQPAAPQDDAAVWAELLAGFEKFRYETRPMRWPKREQGDESLRLLRARIRCECGSSERLQRIGLGLLRRRDLDTYAWEEILQIILDAAEPYYRSLWDLCSREERLVLIQLAQEGLLNPKKVGVMRRLARRRLVSLDPRFRIVNESFARFVCEVEPPARVAEWESTNGSSGWKQIATPLYLLAAVALALLLVTEQTLVTNLLAIATGAAGALGSLRVLMAQFRPSTPPAKAA